MDQIAALHWIQENIIEFGGNPANITLMGHGHGAACVNLLMTSPMASNLFNRVVLMSGSALAPWAIATDSDVYSRHLGKLLDCPNHDNTIMVNCLRSKTAQEILRVDLKVPQHLSAFGPIIDGTVILSPPKDFVTKSHDYYSATAAASSSSSYSNVYSSMYHLSLSSTLSASAPSEPYSLPLTVPLSSTLPVSTSGSSSSSSTFMDASGYSSPSSTYDLLFGITRVEAPYLFTAHEERHGIDMKRRDRILRTLIRNLFDFHQQVILLTLINEYTDWSRPVEHPINLFDSLVDILGDALVVSPLIQTGDTNARYAMSTYTSNSQGSMGTSSSIRRHHHSSSSSSSTGTSSTLSSSSSSIGSASGSSSMNAGNRLTGDYNSGPRTFFYLFSHQSENSGFSPRLGCQHGEEIAYIFGAPLATNLLGQSLSIFHTNYTRQESTLAEAVMTYWTNFVKFGDPNIWPNELDSHGDRTKGRFENVFWPQYDTITRKYLMIGMKPKVRDHYHSHRLSYWLHLVPRLQEISFNEEPLYYYKHHLLPDHESSDSYDGIVRQISLRFHPSSSSSSSSSKLDPNGYNNNSSVTSTGFNTKLTTVNKINANDSTKSQRLGVTKSTSGTSSSSPVNGQQDDYSDDAKLSPSYNNNKTSATSIIMEQSYYSTTLSVTLGIGVSMLILNMLIFAGVYYKAKTNRSKSSTGGAAPLSSSTPCSHLDHHHHHHQQQTVNNDSHHHVNNSTLVVDSNINPILLHHHHLQQQQQQQQQHLRTTDYHNKYEDSLTKDDIPSLTRNSYIIQDCGETKATDDLDLTRTTPGTTGLTLQEEDDLLIDDIDKQLQQQELKDHQRSYQTHYMTNVTLRDSITDLNRLKSDCAKVVITNYNPSRDSMGSGGGGGGGGGTLRRSPKSVLKKTSIEEPVMSVFHYSPSHSITTTGGCPSATCCGSSMDCPVSTIPGYVTLGRSGSHHHQHHLSTQQQQPLQTNYHPTNQSSQSQQQHQIVYNHRALTPSEILTKGSNLIGRCEEETTA